MIPPPIVNPFSTRFVRPGALEFLFPGESNAATLLDRLQNRGWRGAVVGPHGSGKSTLLATLRPLLVSAGRELVEIAMHDRERRLPEPFRDCHGWSSSTLVVVDGYEQLSSLSRWRLSQGVRRRRCGLLVTSHRPTPLPELFRTGDDRNASGHTMLKIVDRLQTTGPNLITVADVRTAVAANGDNLREGLFHLYDAFELRSRAAGPTAVAQARL